MSGINVVYDKLTNRILVTEEDGIWTLPAHWDLAHYENGFEPVFVDMGGDLYLKPNAAIVNDL